MIVQISARTSFEPDSVMELALKD